MKLFARCIIAIASTFVCSFSVFAHANDAAKTDLGGVYCNRYVGSDGSSGFSLYRSSDGADIGNAIWYSLEECQAAASLSNQVREGIACARYHNSTTRETNYSLYRIWDGKDLGPIAITSFDDCQFAVSQTRSGIFCSPYKNNQTGFTGWSMFDLGSGRDIGTNIYNSLSECVKNY